MIEDWCTDRLDDGIDASAATTEIDAWLSEALDGESRRDRLKDEQNRSQLRRDLRDHLRAAAKPCGSGRDLRAGVTDEAPKPPLSPAAAITPPSRPLSLPWSETIFVQSANSPQQLHNCPSRADIG